MQEQEQELSVADQLMIRFGEMSRRSICDVGATELRPGERAMMFCLKFGKRPNMKASELAGKMGIAAPGVTPVLNRLENLGYISRQTDRRDRRVVLVSLTDRGNTMLEEDIVRMRQYFAGLAEYLGEGDCIELLRLFDKTLEYYTQNQT